MKDILYGWSLLNYKKDPENIGSQILWNNSFIKNQSIPIVFLSWTDKGIIYVKDIFDHRNKRIKTFGELQNEFELSTHECLNYHKLVSTLPKEWLRLLKEQFDQVNQNEASLFTIVNEQDQNNICKYMTKLQAQNSNNEEKTKAQL